MKTKAPPENSTPPDAKDHLLQALTGIRFAITQIEAASEKFPAGHVPPSLIGIHPQLRDALLRLNHSIDEIDSIQP